MLLITAQAFAQSENEIINVAEAGKRLTYDISVFPNPSEGPFEIIATPGVRVQISSTSGTYIGTWIMPPEGVLKEELPQGSYLIVISEDANIEVRKLLVL